MTRPSRAWFVSRRALAWSVATIVIPGLVLFGLGIQGALRQQAVLEELTRASQRVSAERVAHDTEQQTLARASHAIREIAGSGVFAANSHHDPVADRRTRLALAAVLSRHEIANSVVLVRDGAVVFPRLALPWLRSLASYAAGEPARVRPAIAALLAEAEREETGGGGVTAAARLYRAVRARATSPAVKALSLAREARCVGVTDRAEARTLLRRLITEFPDQYDPFGRPYAITAAMDLGDEVAVNNALRQVADGRWELSSDQVTYYVNELHARTGEAPKDTTFLKSLHVARAIATAGIPPLPLTSGAPYPMALEVGGKPHQLVYARVTPHAEARSADVVVLAIDLDVVVRTVIPTVATSLQLQVPLVESTTAHPPGPSSGVAGAVAFRELFRFWRLQPPSRDVADAQRAIRRGTLTIVVATILVFGLLAAGVALLVRDVRREAAVSRLKSDFVSSVSHELKTPLTLIRLYADTLAADPDAPCEERQGHCDVITRESERLTGLIDQVLEFSRVERGQKVYRMQSGSLQGVVDSTLSMYEAFLVRRGFALDRRIETVPTTRFDPNAITEALLNLLDNAVKYSRESRWIGVRLLAADTGAVLEVEDRGVGISEPDRRRIFDQFVRVGGESGAGGHGLGLFLVKHIMDAHGGRIEVESVPGRGSRFRLVFPGPEVAHLS